MNDALAIQGKNITKKFKENIAVNNVDLEVRTGEIFCILGPNGAGKTTLIRMLSTLANIDSGEAMIFGYDVRKKPQEVRKRIGITGQYATVDEELTANENLLIFCNLNGLSKAESKERSEQLLEQFSLTDAKNRQLKNFSGGMRRRLDLAISLITRPKLIFLDEPTTGLDPRTRGEMWDVIHQLVESGSTILLTTQYLEEADQLADRIAIIDHGEIIAEGTPASLKKLIGGTNLEVTLSSTDQMIEAKEVMECYSKSEITISLSNCSLSMPVSEEQSLSRVLGDLESKSVMIETFAVKTPSLDEVFLTLTNGG